MALAEKDEKEKDTKIENAVLPPQAPVQKVPVVVPKLNKEALAEHNKQ